MAAWYGPGRRLDRGYPAGGPSRLPRMRRRSLIALIGVYALTRLIGAYLADHPDVYIFWGMGSVTGDIFIYQQWADFLLRHDVAAYSGVGIEYPPGSLPFLALPALLQAGGTYQRAFVWLMVVVDTVGLVGLLAIGRRVRSLHGAWLWTLLVPLLGPIAYARLDLVPSVATIWALSAAGAGAWFSTGAWLGFGALAKIYPGMLLPAAFVAARDRRQLTGGAVLLLVVPLLPFIASLDDVWRSVFGYHTARGLQLESIWSGALLIAGRFGYPASVVFNYGAFHMEAPIAGTLKALSGLLSVAALGAGVWLVWRAVPRGDGARLADALFATLALIMAVGSVFSPQFMLWLAALGAVAAADPRSAVRRSVLLLIPATALTQLLFPFLYAWLAPALTVPVTVLMLRNLLVLGIGVWAFVAVLRAGRAGPAVDEPESVDPPEEAPDLAPA